MVLFEWWSSKMGSHKDQLNLVSEWPILGTDATPEAATAKEADQIDTRKVSRAWTWPSWPPACRSSWDRY